MEPKARVLGADVVVGICVGDAAPFNVVVVESSEPFVVVVIVFVVVIVVVVLGSP